MARDQAFSAVRYLQLQHPIDAGTQASSIDLTRPGQASVQTLEAREILLPQSDHLLRIHPTIMQKSHRLLPTSHRAAPKQLQDGIRVCKSFTNCPVRPVFASHCGAAGRVHD